MVPTDGNPFLPSASLLEVGAAGVEVAEEVVASGWVPAGVTGMEGVGRGRGVDHATDKIDAKEVAGSQAFVDLPYICLRRKP